MRERQLIAGLDRFDKTRDNGHGIAYPTLPVNIGKVHAISDFRWHRTGIYTEPQFCDAPWEYKLALCGAKVKVVLPKVFDPGDPDVCPGCAAEGYKGPTKPRGVSEA
ncbi:MULTISPECIES: hypothetical protein [unclassified Arthrobacter]|uniref:hypothetical protein n=1 Tax=unclassified Arthrobacter TaxID=235627 RepID=UPI000DD1DD61|nr:hypothetical protein [Arthrobacter sp. H-02-3]PVZ52692.1 hypothetical protein C9424_19605 [Arthrobacter sp. H-02-3]